MSTHFFTNRDDSSLLKKFEGALEHGYGKGTSFTKLKGHRLHFFSRIYSQKMKYPRWGAKKIRVLLFNELPNEDIPSVVTVHNILGSREDMAGGYSLQKGEHILRSNIKFDYSDVNDTMEFIQQCIVPCGVLRHHTRKASDTFHKN
jgi:hypothetical protein